MTRFIYDQFTKELLAEVLGYIGMRNLDRSIYYEVRQIDSYFTPSPGKSDYLEYREKLGLLGKMATTPALFEPYRNTVTVAEVRSCLSKLLNVTANLKQQAERKNINLSQTDLPFLWILTPTAWSPLLNGFNATTDEDNWGKGIYFLGEYWRTAIVVIHRLPEVKETLWLRILGRREVQLRAINSLRTLPVDDPLRVRVLSLLYQLQVNLRANRSEKSQLEVQEDENLIMAIAPLFQEQLAAAEL